MPGPLRNLTIFLLVFLATLAGLDAYVQLAAILTPMETRIDPVLGPTYIPGRFVVRFSEGYFMGRINELGYFGPAVPRRRQAGERRVLLLGDSYVLGHTVFGRDHFARRLEADLGRSLARPVRALNFGKADFSLADMYHYHRGFAGTFDHDVALFFVSRFNLLGSPSIGAALYPAVRLRDDSLVVWPVDTRGRTYRFYKGIEPVFTRSAVLRLVFNAYKLAQVNRYRLVQARNRVARLVRPRPEPPPPAPAPARLPELNAAVLRALARDPRNLLVTRERLDPGLLADVRATGIAVLDLGVPLEAMAARGEDPSYWPVTGVRGGHWNHAAHAAIGRYLAAQLAARGPLAPGAVAAR